MVTRNLHQLQVEGLIEILRDEVVLLDPVPLSEEIAEPWLRTAHRAGIADEAR